MENETKERKKGNNLYLMFLRCDVSVKDSEN